jgi:hypothetical protein
MHLIGVHGNTVKAAGSKLLEEKSGCDDDKG